MSVIQVTQQSKLRAGTAEFSTFGDSTKLFLVRTDDANDDEGVVLSIAGSSYPGPDVLPIMGDPHPTRGGIYAKTYSYRQCDENNGQTWEVTVNYSKYDPLPWNAPPLRSWGSQPVQYPADRDCYGKAIINSALLPYDPSLSVTVYEPILTVSFATQTFDETMPLAYSGACNADTFYGAPPGYCLCTGIVPSQQSVQLGDVLTIYWTVQCGFHFKLIEKWSPSKILDAGYAKRGTDGKLTPILIGNREPSSPVPLDGNGQPLGPGKDPVFKEYAMMRSVPFAFLGI